MRKGEVGLPPNELGSNEIIAKVVLNRGNTFDVDVPDSQSQRVRQVLDEDEDARILLVGLSPNLRNKYFVQRNGLVVVSLEKLGPNGKIKGEITNVVGDLRDWQRSVADFPPEFAKKEEAVTLDLPPSLSDEEYESDEYEAAEDGATGGDDAAAGGPASISSEK